MPPDSTGNADEYEAGGRNPVFLEPDGALHAGGAAITVLNLAGLPAADPHVVGQVWKNAGVLTVSAG